MVKFVKIFALAILLANGNGRALGLADLPADLRNLLILKLPITDILRVCSTSEAMRAFCNNHETNLWTLLLERDFGDKLYSRSSKEWPMSPKDVYLENYKLRLRNVKAVKQEKDLKYLAEDIDGTPYTGDASYLVGGNLSKAALDRAQLEKAKLSLADLSNANLKGANLKYADLEKANFTEADCTETDFSYASMSSSDFTGATCPKAIFGYSRMKEANFTGANLAGAKFRFATNLENATFKDANLEKASFFVPGSTFTGVNFTGANLTGAVFAQSNDDPGTPITLALLKEKGATWDEQNPPRTE